MSGIIIDGKKIAANVKAETAKEVDELLKQGVAPCLAVVLVGDDSASMVYVGNKERACLAVGIKSLVFDKKADITEAELLALIENLNNDASVNGILVQLPLPSHIDEKKVIEAISPLKDVDCFHPYNVGRLYTSGDGFKPCTPAGIIELLKQSGLEISGKNAVVIGRSNIVGKPVAMLLMAENATVTVCHSKTKNLAEICSQSDIIVSATGKLNTVTADMVKPDAVVIDVGMNRDENHKLCGDVDFESVKELAGAITPVPGGVGPMTIAMLMKNCVKAAKLQM